MYFLFSTFPRQSSQLVVIPPFPSLLLSLHYLQVRCCIMSSIALQCFHRIMTQQLCNQARVFLYYLLRCTHIIFPLPISFFFLLFCPKDGRTAKQTHDKRHAKKRIDRLISAASLQRMHDADALRNKNTYKDIKAIVARYVGVIELLQSM